MEIPRRSFVLYWNFSAAKSPQAPGPLGMRRHGGRREARVTGSTPPFSRPGPRPGPPRRRQAAQAAQAGQAGHARPFELRPIHPTFKLKLTIGCLKMFPRRGRGRDGSNRRDELKMYDAGKQVMRHGEAGRAEPLRLVTLSRCVQSAASISKYHSLLHPRVERQFRRFCISDSSHRSAKSGDPGYSPVSHVRGRDIILRCRQTPHTHEHIQTNTRIHANSHGKSTKVGRQLPPLQ